MANDISIEFDQTTITKFNNCVDGIVKDFTPEKGSELHKFLIETGNNLATEIKQPPPMPVKTGRLMASVHVKSKSSDGYSYKNDLGEEFLGGLQEPVSEGEEIVIGTNVEYAARMESQYGFFLKAISSNTSKINSNLDKLAKKVINKNAK